jgi:microcystin-dependent protein
MGTPYLGEIRMFGGVFAPRDWAFCDGRLLPISQNSTLFTLIGTTYGGDGVNNFALPDLRGRLPVHVGPQFSLGQKAGNESVTLNLAQLPPHQHAPAASSGSGDANSPQKAVWATGAGSYYTAGTANATMSTLAVQSTGSGQPHDNLSPFLVVTFIIALVGIWPSQN